MRTISKKFIDFWKENELLDDLKKQIQNDSSLDCEIRENKLQFYYRGAEIFSICEDKNNFYLCKSENSQIDKQKELLTKYSLELLMKKTIPERKNILDGIKQNGPEGTERETQQIIVRENNFNTKAENTDYYIADIEYAHSNTGLRFDLLAVKSIHDGEDRKTPAKKFAVIELKYDMDAVFQGKKEKHDGEEPKSSLKAHFKDLSNFISNPKNIDNLKEQIRYSFNLKVDFGLIQKPNIKSSFKLDESSLSEKPEYIIILANYDVYNLSKSDLSNLLTEIKNCYPKVFNFFDVKFATSAFMGYGLYSNFMIPFDSFVERITKKGLSDDDFLDKAERESLWEVTWHRNETQEAYEARIMSKAIKMYKDAFKLTESRERFNPTKDELTNPYTIDALYALEKKNGEKWVLLSNPGYTRYAVSSNGRVAFKIKERYFVIEQDDANSPGYLYLNPNKEYYVDHNIEVYKLIAMGFLGKTLSDGYDVHHIINDGYNCRPENLILLTRAQHNAIHSISGPKEYLLKLKTEKEGD